MGERTSYAPGTFCWADLGTVDPAGARDFYVGLFGWEAFDAPMGDAGVYTTFRLGGHGVCALYGRTDAAQTRPAWLSYVSVEDVEAVTAKAGAAGGEVLQGPLDVFDAGRTAVLRDPTGAVFALWEPGTSIGATIVNGPGALCLNQLNTAAPERAATFYADVFGWRIESVGTDVQPYWGIFNGPGVNGGMMPLPPETGAPSHWLVYFGSDDIDGAAVRAGRLGGRVAVAPTAVPSGRITVVFDPQGAAFALFEGRFDP